MIAAAITFVGICLGSFVNALVWRLHERTKILENLAKSGKKATSGEAERLRKLSVSKGRSMCIHCGHELSGKDLVPVLSYIGLRGKCRYCQGKIEDTPIVELASGGLALISYLLWPYQLTAGLDIAIFAAWLGLLTVMVALAVYDARWYILPDRLVLAATILAAAVVALVAIDQSDLAVIWGAAAGAAVIAGGFYLLYQISDGRWIGGGDVKLGLALGFLAGSWQGGLAVIFIASVLGSFYAIAGAIIKRKTLTAASKVPFGPFLLAAAYLVFIIGTSILNWYKDLIGLG